MSLDNTKREYQRLATVEVVGFMELQVHPKVTGREMLQELLKVYPEGIPEVSNGISILPTKGGCRSNSQQELSCCVFSPNQEALLFCLQIA